MATKEEQREYQRKWVAQRRAAFFADKICARCGNNELLELDHLDPCQKIASAIWSWSPSRQATEIAKCQILCKPCHALKTVENLERASGESHGATFLTEGQVREMKQRYANGEGPTSIGESFALDRKRTYSIIRQWKYISGE